MKYEVTTPDDEKIEIEADNLVHSNGILILRNAEDTAIACFAVNEWRYVKKGNTTLSAKEN